MIRVMLTNTEQFYVKSSCSSLLLLLIKCVSEHVFFIALCPNQGYLISFLLPLITCTTSGPFSTSPCLHTTNHLDIYLLPKQCQNNDINFSTLTNASLTSSEITTDANFLMLNLDEVLLCSHWSGHWAFQSGHPTSAPHIQCGSMVSGCWQDTDRHTELGIWLESGSWTGSIANGSVWVERNLNRGYTHCSIVTICRSIPKPQVPLL